MPQFIVTAPNGKKYRITAPEGTTKQQALDHFKSQLGGKAAAPPKPSVSRETPPKDQGMPLGDVAVGAVKSIPSSAASTIGGIYQAVRHPIRTAETLYHTAVGEAQNLEGQQIAPEEFERNQSLGKPNTTPTEDKAYADAINSYFVNRYGSVEGFKKAVASDPVGVATDLSSVLGGGEAALARAGGTAGRVGRIAGAAGRVTNPVSLAARAVGAVARPVGHLASEALGVTTGAGGRAIRLAAEAGFHGAAASQAFLDAMRQRVPPEQVVQTARAAINQMRQERNAAYRAGMVPIQNDRTILSMQPILQELQNTNQIHSFRGIDIAPQTTQIRQQVADLVNNWNGLNPADYHTPEGLDALKKQVGDLRDSTAYGTPQRIIVDNVYHAIGNTIRQQAPAYDRVMHDYEQATEELRNIQDGLAVRTEAGRTRVDTALRRLQSIMRDNVQTNHGYRYQLAQTLVQHGAQNLEHSLAGGQLSATVPRGLIARGGAYTLAADAVREAVLHGNLTPAAALPLTSPRLVGEATHGAGVAARYLSGRVPADIAQTATQSAPTVFELSRPQTAKDMLPAQ